LAAFSGNAALGLGRDPSNGPTHEIKAFVTVGVPANASPMVMDDPALSPPGKGEGKLADGPSVPEAGTKDLAEQHPAPPIPAGVTPSCAATAAGNDRSPGASGLPLDAGEQAAASSPKVQPGGVGAGTGSVAGVPIEAMIGQMIMVGFIGTEPTDPWPAQLIGQIGAGEVGGVLFLGRNAVSVDQVGTLNEALLKASGDLPVFLAIDQEGGRVQRLTSQTGFTERPSAHDVAGSLSVPAATEMYAGLARDLMKLHFNLNLGPVVDVDVNPLNPIIGALGRSFSQDPETVVAYGRAFIDGHHAAGMLTALKHFPGHGSSRDDSHKGFVDITNTWSPAELEPYQKLIGEGKVDMVMIGHLYLRQFDEANQQVPASLSKSAIDVLRVKYGFGGVVISDDMEMKAIDGLYSVEDAAVSAVLAGTNILIYSNYGNPRPDLPATIIKVLKDRSMTDPDLRRHIEDSYNKIVALKRTLCS
jgi:beta-N-acetylhexosaminidase